MEKTFLSPENPAPQEKREDFWKELAHLIILAAVIVVPIRIFIAKPFIVDGASMDPTFRNGQYLIVDELSYRFDGPKRGDIIVFKYPRDPKKSFIKRVIGLPREIVSIKDGKVTITSNTYPKGLVLDEPYVEFEKKDSLSYVLGEDQYFVMGDNRASSADSRIWGPVPEKNIVGRPLVRFIPPSFLPGKAEYLEASQQE